MSDKAEKITIGLEARPWEIPDGVHINMPPGKRQDGFIVAKPISLKDVDAEILAQLCNRFRKDVFKAAGKEDPEIAKIRQC